MCGANKRVTANNFIYYIYILGEAVVVLFAYFIRDFKYLYASYTCIMIMFLFYFWYVPESPRWLMAKNKNNEAYKIFKRIAESNKKCDNLKQLESIRERDLPSAYNRRRLTDMMHMKVVNEISTSNELAEMKLKESLNSSMNHTSSAKIFNKPISFFETIKLFFRSKKLLIRSCILLLNWLTNTLVYYGISFNTTELIGDPYLNFFLSILVEFVAILACQFTLEKFGRKVPYSINMTLAGMTLLCVQFVPTSRLII